MLSQVCLSLLLRRGGLQTAFLLVPMGIGMAASLADLPVRPVPPWLSAAAQCALGVALGSEFRRSGLRKLRRYIAAAVLNVLVLLAGSVAIALLVAAVSGIPLPTAILSMAPGGVTEMALTARALHFDVSTVTAFHVIRIFVVLALAPVVFSFLLRVGFFQTKKDAS